MREKLAKTEHLKKRLFQIVEVGYTQDRVSRLYDIVNVAAIIINLIVSILYTFDPMEERYGGAIVAIESITVMFFALDYILRVYTARYLCEDGPEWKAILQYVFSFTGIVDLLSFLPYSLPFFFPDSHRGSAARTLSLLVMVSVAVMVIFFSLTPAAAHMPSSLRSALGTQIKRMAPFSGMGISAFEITGL